MTRLPIGRSLFCASGALLCSAMLMDAHAQDETISEAPATTEADATEEDPTARMNAVVVSARRRDELLQDVPAAITAFTSQDIDDAGITKPADFIGLTSNVTLVETQNAGNAFIVIRGISQARNSEPSVAVIVDGVQQVNPAQFNQELFDIQQIEVLKGPQGGLYGRNAIGGAIVITTEPPSDEFEGKITAGIDNGFGYTLRGGISGPLADNVHYRLSGSWVDTDGYIENEFLGEEADPYEDLSLRGRLIWDVTDDFEVDLRASLSELRTQALYFNIVADVNDTSLPVRVNNAGQNDRDMFNASAKLTYDADFGTFTSITAFDTLEEVLTGDAFDFLPIEESLFFQILGFDLNQSQFLDTESWSQEVRFTSPADDRFSYIVGAYAVGTDRYISTGNMIDMDMGVFPVFRTPSTNPSNPQFSFLADSQENFAWAVFGNASYQFTDQLELDVSLRYDEDTRENTTLTPTEFLPNVPGFPPGVTGEVRERTFDELQPKVTLTYEATDSATFYGGYSKGFRSGGFNQTGVGAVAADNGILGVNDIFEAEVAETYELGAKFAFDALQVNTAVYTTKSENSYFFVFLAANSTQNLGNVPEATIQGFEIDASTRIGNLDLNAAFGYVDSEIDQFPDPAFEGNQVPLVSEYTFNLGAQYTHDFSSALRGIARVDYQKIGDTYWDVQNSTVRDPIDLVDVRVGVEGDSWALTAFSKNLFDEEYNAEFSPGGFVYKARPRVYGIELDYEF